VVVHSLKREYAFLSFSCGLASKRTKNYQRLSRDQTPAAHGTNTPHSSQLLPSSSPNDVRACGVKGCVVVRQDNIAHKKPAIYDPERLVPAMSYSVLTACVMAFNNLWKRPMEAVRGNCKRDGVLKWRVFSFLESAARPATTKKKETERPSIKDHPKKPPEPLNGWFLNL